jgi:hypothetical protein
MTIWKPSMFKKNVIIQIIYLNNEHKYFYLSEEDYMAIYENLTVFSCGLQIHLP